METKKTDLNAIVAKNHLAVGLLRKYGLTELRLIAFCLAHYDSRKDDNRHITARVDDLLEIFPSMDAKSAYAVVRQTVIRINSKPAEIEDELVVHLLFWFTGFKYFKKTGEFSFSISPEMQPFLLDLQGNFARYRLADVYQFRSANTWKLYENLAQWRTAGRWSPDLDELRYKIGVAGKYPIWGTFNRDVIAPAVEEINALSDLRVEYHQEKRGRRIIGLVFLIDKKINDKEVINQEPSENELLRLLLDHGINVKTAEDYAKKINDQGKADTITAKMPQIALRAQKSGHPTQKYILGAINNELGQMSLLKAPPQEKPDHAECMECWTKKRQRGEECKVRVRGVAGQRKKCQLCLEKIPAETWGL